MSREKDLAVNTAVLTFGKIFTQFVSFLLLPLYTAILEPEVYGIADLFNSYIYLIIPIVSLMLDQGLFRFLLECRNDLKRQNRLLSTVVNINLLEIIVYTLIFGVIQCLIRSQYKVFLLIDVSLNILLNTFMQYARGIGKNGVYAVTSFLSASMIVVSNVILLVVLKLGAWGLFFSTVAGRSIALVAIMIMLQVWKRYNIFAFSKSEAKELLQYSLPFIPNQLSWWVIGVSDRTIISWFISVAANGLYSVANKFSSIYIAFYNIFNLSWTESVSLHIHDDDIHEYLEKTINALFALLYSVCFGIIAFMPLVFPILINSQYNEAYPQIPILMVSVLFQALVGLYSVIYVALKNSKEIAKTSFFAAVINISVDIILIRYIGLYAASISTLVAYASMAVYRYFHIKRYINVPLKHIAVYIFVGCIIGASYYLNITWLNLITALFMTFFVCLINRSFLMNLLQQIINRVSKKDERKE